jgi:hypothetical protein
MIPARPYMAKKSRLAVFLVALLVAAAVIAGTHIYQESARAKAAADARYKRSIQRQSDELVIASELRSIAIRIESLRTEDQLAGIEGRLAQNQVAIADLENRRMTEDLFRSEQNAMADALALLEKTDAKDRPFPDLFAAQEAAIEDYIDALIARRRANAGGNEDANKATDEMLDATRQRALATAEKYKDAVETASRRNGR